MQNDRFKTFSTDMGSAGTRTGFSIKFDNGYTISVIFGAGTYSGGNTCEVACLDRNNNFVPIMDNQQDDVIGYVSPDELPAIMDKIKSLYK